MIQKSLTVLVAEDEPLLAMNLELGLEDAGYTVVLATTGDAAIRKLEQDPHRYCAVVTDIRMPGDADGWQLGRRARELRPDIPVVYASGDSCNNWRSFGVSDSAMLPKPFPIERLIACLERCLELAEQDRCETSCRTTIKGRSASPHILVGNTVSGDIVGLRILVVEDDFLLASDVADQVTAAGGLLVGPAPAVAVAFTGSPNSPLTRSAERDHVITPA